MDSRSDDRAVPPSSETAGGGGQEANDKAEDLTIDDLDDLEWPWEDPAWNDVKKLTDEELDNYEPTEFWEDGEPCLTEALLKKWGIFPVPDWARKPPGPKEQSLFDEE
jgi:hypothetical protein